MCVLLRKERVHGKKAVDDTSSGADDSGALSGHVPSDPEAWGKILVVAFINRADVLAHLFKTDRRLPISEQVVCFLRNTLELVAESEIHSDPWSDAPVVLGVTGVKPLGNITGGISSQKGGIPRYSSEKVFEWRGASGNSVALESDPPSPCTECGLMDLVFAEFATELKGVLAT